MGKMSKIKSEKFTFFTFWMTICIIVYHTAPHLLVMAGMGGDCPKTRMSFHQN